MTLQTLDRPVRLERVERLERRAAPHAGPGVDPRVVVVPEPAGEGAPEVGAGRVLPEVVELLVIGRVRPLHPPIQPGRPRGDQPVLRPEGLDHHGERMGFHRAVQGRLRPRGGPSE